MSMCPSDSSGDIPSLLGIGTDSQPPQFHRPQPGDGVATVASARESLDVVVVVVELAR